VYVCALIAKLTFFVGVAEVFVCGKTILNYAFVKGGHSCAISLNKFELTYKISSLIAVLCTTGNTCIPGPELHQSNVLLIF
jgi:hypothetical protein